MFTVVERKEPGVVPQIGEATVPNIDSQLWSPLEAVLKTGGDEDIRAHLLAILDRATSPVDRARTSRQLLEHLLMRYPGRIFTAGDCSKLKKICAKSMRGFMIRATNMQVSIAFMVSLMKQVL